MSRLRFATLVLTQVFYLTGAGGLEIGVYSAFVYLQSLPRSEIKIALETQRALIALTEPLVKIIVRFGPRLTVKTQKLSSTDLQSGHTGRFAQSVW